MARDTRGLALAEDLRQVADREVALGAQRQHAQARRLADGAQAAEQVVERAAVGVMRGSAPWGAVVIV